MRRIGFFLMALAMMLAFGVTPVMAQTAPAQSSLLTGLLKKQKPAPLRSQTVSVPGSEASVKKAAEASRRITQNMIAQQQAETARQAPGLEAMFAAERAKAEASAARQREALAQAQAQPLSGVPGAPVTEGKQNVAPPAKAVRVYVPKKNTTSDQPRRLFNVREQ